MCAHVPEAVIDRGGNKGSQKSTDDQKVQPARQHNILEDSRREKKLHRKEKRREGIS